MYLIREGLRPNVIHSLESRRFKILLDPACVDDLTSNIYSDILQLIIDLSLLDPPLRFDLLVTNPPFPDDPLFNQVDEPIDNVDFSPANISPDDHRRRLLDNTEEAVRLRRLCAKAVVLKVNAILTHEPALILSRDALYQHDFIRIIPLGEFADFVEICAHGHGIFWSTSHTDALTQDVYYTLAHPKGAKLAWWFHSFKPDALSAEVREELRSIVLNRYPFLLYGRDMVRFFQIQRDSKHQGLEDFSVPLSYHVNAFYILLWGMLDHLCLLANIRFNLGVKARLCGIRSGTFLDALKKNRPNIYKFISLVPISQWIDLMADFRHAAAHKVIPIPTKLVAETEDFRKTDGEILEILKDQNPRQFAVFEETMSPEVRKALEDLYLFTWRRGAVKHVADHVVFIRGKQESYWRSPVLSIDYDLSTLTGIMDGFLVALFNNVNIGQPSDMLP
jgi:hypothetical protein